MPNGIGEAVARQPVLAAGMRGLARAGAFAEGVVYLAIGVMSAMGAALAGRGPQGPTRALTTASFQIAGAPLLLVVGIGLLALVLWQLLVAILDLEDDGRDGAGVFKRGVALVGALVYAGLALWSLRAATTGVGATSDDGSAGRATAAALEQPFGRWIVLIGAGAILAFAAFELLLAWRSDLGARLKLYGGPRRFAVAMGRAGLTARGVVLGVIGGYVLVAARERNPREARGIEGALRALDGQPFGTWLMIGVAVGLGLYGVWRLTEAVFAEVKLPRGT